MADRDKLILDNMGLAGYVAKQFNNCQIPYEDRMQIACLGLIKAADNFDDTKGAKFSNYAVVVIRTEILME